MDLTAGTPQPQQTRQASGLGQAFPAHPQPTGFDSFGMNLSLAAGTPQRQPGFGQQTNAFAPGFGQPQFGQPLGFGATPSPTPGFGLAPSPGFGQPQTGFGAGFGAQAGLTHAQPKKLITFDSTPTTADEFSTFQEAKPRNPVVSAEQALKNYTSAEADLIDLSELTSDAFKKGKKDSHSINLGGW